MWNIFRPFYEMYKQIHQSFGKEAVVQLMYNLLSLLGCEEVSFSLPLAWYRIFNCRGMYVEVYVDRYIKEPKRRSKIKYNIIRDKLINELLVIRPLGLIGDIEFAPGSQPTLNIDIGRCRVKRLEFSGPRLDIYLEWPQLRNGLPQVTRIPIDFSIPSYSTSPIGIVFSSIDGIRTEEQADVATKVLSAIYEQKRDEITGYVEKVSKFLDKIFRGLSIYLLY
jgi:hypothetical protein